MSWICKDPISNVRFLDDLKQFLLASRAAYNAFVLYHNFRHVIDVLQAVFWCLTHIGALPPYPFLADSCQEIQPLSPVAALLKPLDALTLLISAIGHDVGHPGVNNAFLVALNAPLAQLYNDKSVLEAFHCAAYSQILRRYWRQAFSSTAMRALMINSILATDMGLHFKYMFDLGSLQEKIHHNNGTDGWSSQKLDEYRTLTCGLLIKCADISNVVCTVRLISARAPLTLIRLDPSTLLLSGQIFFNLSLPIRAKWRRKWEYRQPFSVVRPIWGILSSSQIRR